MTLNRAISSRSSTNSSTGRSPARGWIRLGHNLLVLDMNLDRMTHVLGSEYRLACAAEPQAHKLAGPSSPRDADQLNRPPRTSEITKKFHTMGTLSMRLGDWLLGKALAAQCRQAGLARACARLSFGQVDYLHRKGHARNPGEAIVMLHGAASDRTAWVRCAKHLASDRSLVIPDLPGHGASSADMHLDYGINAQAERLKELLASLGFARVHLVGNSMGAAIAMRLAATTDNFVSSLVLISAAGFEVSRSWLREHVERTGINPMIHVRHSSDYRSMMRIGMSKPPYVPGLVLEALTRTFVGRAAINAKIASDIQRDLGQAQALPGINIPSLVIWGEEDKVVHVDNAEFLRRHLPRSQKVVLPGIGHVPMVEAPVAEKETA